MARTGAKTSSPTLPPYIEEKLVNVALGDQESVLALRDALLKAFYPAVDDRCPMCGGTGLYPSTVGGREMEEGCDSCGGTGRTSQSQDGVRSNIETAMRNAQLESDVLHMRNVANIYHKLLGGALCAFCGEALGEDEAPQMDEHERTVHVHCLEKSNSDPTA